MRVLLEESEGTAADDKKSETIGRSDSKVSRIRRGGDDDDDDIRPGDASSSPTTREGDRRFEEDAEDGPAVPSRWGQSVGEREAAVCNRIPR